MPLCLRSLISKKNSLTKNFWLGFLSLLLLCLLSLTGLAALNRGRVVMGLTAGDLELGRLKPEKAEAILAQQTEIFSQQKLPFVFEDKTWLLSPAEVGLRIETGQTVAAAMKIGRGPLVASALEQIKIFFLGEDIPFAFSINSAKFKLAFLVLSSLETPPVNASLEYDASQDNFIVVPAQTGLIINRRQLIADILENFSQPREKPIHLTLDKARPLVDEQEISLVVEQAKMMVADAPYFLQSNEATWRVDKAELASWITALVSPDSPQTARLALNENAIVEFLTPLAASINRDPIDAKLTWENNEVKSAFLAQNGQKLNLAASAEKISEEILNGNDQKNIELVIEVVEPKVSNKSLKELGLVMLLGSGESNFSGSPKNRRANIQVGATKLNGLLIKPGEEFSFSQNIGEIGAANGWLPELVIKNNQTIPEFGGGLCQVSTTLFRAVLNSGLKITERHPHAYPVHYYNPPGFDATVYPPSPDLKFLNNTPGNILLQDKIVGNKLFFEIYGTNDGREVKITGPSVTQKNPDGSLKTILTQEIWRDGKLEQNNVFRSAYKSAALFPIATPTPTPTPTPIPTPTPSPTPSVAP